MFSFKFCIEEMFTEEVAESIYSVHDDASFSSENGETYVAFDRDGEDYETVVAKAREDLEELDLTIIRLEREEEDEEEEDDEEEE